MVMGFTVLAPSAGAAPAPLFSDYWNGGSSETPDLSPESIFEMNLEIAKMVEQLKLSKERSELISAFRDKSGASSLDYLSSRWSMILAALLGKSGNFTDDASAKAIELSDADKARLKGGDLSSGG